MGATLNIKELTNKKEQLLDQLHDNIRSWDGTIESGVSVIEGNQYIIGEIELVNKELSKTNAGAEDLSICNEKLIKVAEAFQNLTTNLEELKKTLLEEKKSLGRKDEVVESYIEKRNETFFINRNV